jgi:uncharacterized membrane protein YkoI
MLALPTVIGSTQAERPIAMTAAEIEQVMSKVKAQHPGASILKIEREREERLGDREIYEVKLLRPDGQVLKLYYDGATLAPIAHRADDDDSGEQHRRRERRRGHW